MKTRKQLEEDFIEIKSSKAKQLSNLFFELEKNPQEIIKILGKRISKKGKIQYKVMYKGQFEEDEAVWKKKEDINLYSDIQKIIEFEKNLITRAQKNEKTFKQQLKSNKGCPKSVKKIKKAREKEKKLQEEKSEASEQFIKDSEESSSIAVETESEKEASLESEEEIQVQEPKIRKIIGKRIHKGRTQYLVKFEDSWKNKEELKGSEKLIKYFNEH